MDSENTKIIDKDVLVKAVGVFLDAGTYSAALKAAQLLQEPVRTEQFIRILDSYLDEDDFHEAKALAETFAEPERTEQLTKILNKCLDENEREVAEEIIIILGM